MITATFENVGRNKMNWSAQFATLDHDALYRSVKSKRALMSSDIDFGFDAPADGVLKGTIFAGFRGVGTVSIEGLPANHAFMQP